MMTLPPLRTRAVHRLFDGYGLELSKVRSWTWRTQVRTGPDPKCPGPGPAGEWTGPRVRTWTEPRRE